MQARAHARARPPLNSLRAPTTAPLPTQYEVSVVGVHGGGSLSPASNTINIVMLAEG